MQQYKYHAPAELKRQALNTMAGRYANAVPVTISYFIWVYLITYSGSILSALIGRASFFSDIRASLTSDIVFTIISTLISAFLEIIAGMFGCGICLYYLNISTGRDAQTADIFHGFRENPSKVFQISAFLAMPALILSVPLNILSELYILTGVRTYLVSALVFWVLGMTASLIMHINFGIAYFMMLDFPSYSTGRILKITMDKMKGQRVRLFVLDLHFIPLLILSVLSMGVGLFWVYPILSESHALFFLNLMNPDHYVSIDKRI